jgi:hypothetical protein
MLTIWSFVPSFLLPVPSCSAAEAAVAAGLAVTAAGGSTEAASTAAAAAAEQATTAAGGSAAEAAAAAGAATTAAGGSAAEAEAAATAACAQSTHWSCIGNGGTGQTGGGAQQGGGQAGVGEPTQAPVHSTVPNIAGGSSSNFYIVPGYAINNEIQFQVVFFRKSLDKWINSVKIPLLIILKSSNTSIEQSVHNRIAVHS